MKKILLILTIFSSITLVGYLMSYCSSQELSIGCILTILSAIVYICTARLTKSQQQPKKQHKTPFNVSLISLHQGMKHFEEPWQRMIDETNDKFFNSTL